MATSGLGNLLVNEGLLTENDRRTIADTAGQGSSSFAKGVLALGLLDEEELAAFIANRTRFPLAARSIETEIKGDPSSVLSPNLLKLLEILPLRVDDATFTVAMVDPLDRETAHQAEFFSGRKVKPVVATLTQIIKGLQMIMPDFNPRSSPLEEFLANHAESAGRKLNQPSGGYLEAAPEEQQEADSANYRESQGEEQLISESVAGMQGADLSSVDTISKDATEVSDGAAEDPFAKMDDAPSMEFTEDQVLDETGDVTMDLSDSTANASGDVSESIELKTDEGAAAPESTPATDAEAAFAAAAAADETMTGDVPSEDIPLETTADETLELTEQPAEQSIDAPIETAAATEETIDRPMAEAAQQEEAALAQELGLESADMAAPAGQLPESEPVVDAAAPELPTEVSEEAASPDESIELTSEDDAPMEEAPVAEPTEDISEALTSAQRIAVVNRTLLAIQLAVSQEKVLEKTAQGLGSAECIPGVLYGKTKDGRKAIFMWEGSPKDVRVTHGQLGQLDTTSLEEAAANCPQGEVSSISQSANFMGLQIPAEKGYIVSFTQPDGSSFVAAFEADPGFKGETGLHSTMIELLRRVATRIK